MVGAPPLPETPVRHTWTIAVFLFAAVAALPVSAQTRAVVLDFELIDEMHDPATREGDRSRLEKVSARFPEALRNCGTLAVLPPPKPVIELLASQIAYVHQCNGCAEDIAKAAGADIVVFTWVQKVSNLIINLNAEAQDAGGRTLDVRSVDMRGNTDTSWLRAADALAKRLCERVK